MSAQIQSIGLETHAWSEKNISAFYLRSCDSTNNLAKLETLKTSPYLFITDYQTAGRGRGSNSWLSPETGSSLLSSWVFMMDSAPHPLLSLRIGLSLYQSLKFTFPDINLSLKAPNDIYLENKKLAGILIEVSTSAENHKVIIGLGVNVFKSTELSTSICLSEAANISSIKWREFLNQFWGNIQKATLAAQITELSQAECSDLKSALNQFPLLNEKYQSVLSDGSLKTSLKTIHWSEL